MYKPMDEHADNRNEYIEHFPSVLENFAFSGFTFKYSSCSLTAFGAWIVLERDEERIYI